MNSNFTSDLFLLTPTPKGVEKDQKQKTFTDGNPIALKITEFFSDFKNIQIQ